MIKSSKRGCKVKGTEAVVRADLSQAIYSVKTALEKVMSPEDVEFKLRMSLEYALLTNTGMEAEEVVTEAYHRVRRYFRNAENENESCAHCGGSCKSTARESEECPE